MARRANPWRAPLARFADGPDLVLVDEEVGVSLARKPQHGVVEVFDPAANGLSVPQLDLDNHLTVAERAQIERLLAGVARRRRLGTVAR